MHSHPIHVEKLWIVYSLLMFNKSGRSINVMLDCQPLVNNDCRGLLPPNRSDFNKEGQSSLIWLCALLFRIKFQRNEGLPAWNQLLVSRQTPFTFGNVIIFKKRGPRCNSLKAHFLFFFLFLNSVNNVLGETSASDRLNTTAAEGWLYSFADGFKCSEQTWEKTGGKMGSFGAGIVEDSNFSVGRSQR